MEKPESITTNDWKLLKAKYKNLNNSIAIRLDKNAREKEQLIQITETL